MVRLYYSITIPDIAIKNFAWEDQSQKQCYIADIEPDKAVIEPETREQCSYRMGNKMKDFIPLVFAVYIDGQGSKQ